MATHTHSPAGSAQGPGDDHNHGAHGHGDHSHAPKDFGRAFAIGIALNAAFVGIETVYGLIANSTALLADAGHNLSDVLGLVVAWGGAILGKRAPSTRFPGGFGRASILAALMNGMFLLIAAAVIGWEAVHRLISPEPTAEITVMVVAAIGIAINGFTAWLFASSGDDINIRGAYLHMAADAAISAGVVIAGLLSLITGWLLIDPLVSLAILAVIVWSSWGLMRNAVDLSLDAVPHWINSGDVSAILAVCPGVTGVEDLHIWATSTTQAALTARLVTPAGHPGDAALETVRLELRTRFRIERATFETATGPLAS